VDPGRDYDFSHPQSFNLYAYVRNNPVTFVDSDGRAVVLPAKDGRAALLPPVAGAVVGPYLGKVGAQALGGGLGSLAAAYTFYALDRTQANKPALLRWLMTSGASAFFKGALAAGADALLRPIPKWGGVAGMIAGASTNAKITAGSAEEKINAGFSYVLGSLVQSIGQFAKEQNPAAAAIAGFVTMYTAGLTAETAEKMLNTADTMKTDAKGASPDLNTRVETTQELMEDPEFQKQPLVKVRDQDNPAHPQ